jgi:hypothetical protein
VSRTFFSFPSLLRDPRYGVKLTTKIHLKRFSRLASTKRNFSLSHKGMRYADRKIREFWELGHLEVVGRGIRTSRASGGGDKLRFLFQWLSQQSTFITSQLITILLFCRQFHAEMLIRLRFQLRWHAASEFVRVTRGVNCVNLTGCFQPAWQLNGTSTRKLSVPKN